MHKLSRHAFALSVSSLCFLGMMGVACHVPAQGSSAGQSYTAPDQSASASVPSGWKVTDGSQTVIKMTGPEGASVELGTTFVAKNAAFQAGQRQASGIDVSMPYATPLPQKLGMIFQQAAALSNAPFSQFTIASSTALQLPEELGQCARIVASFTGKQGSTKVMAVFCSLPVDAGGTYKNILLEGQAPPAAAAQDAPTVQTIFQSYRIPATWLQRKLAPVQAPAPSTMAMQNAETAAIMRSTNQAAAASDVSANCFDLSVLRQTPTYELPRSCGGTRPD